MIRPTDWMSLCLDSWRLGVEASSVMTMRMTKLAAGDAAAFAEAQRMVSEKIEAATALQLRAMAGTLGTTPARRAEATIAHYRKAVGRNRRRLRRER